MRWLTGYWTVLRSCCQELAPAFQRGINLSRAPAQPHAAPDPVVPIIGIIASDDAAMAEAVVKLEQDVGKVRLKSAACPWTYSSYYESEMGPSLVRRFLGLGFLIPAENLVQLKASTTGIENQLRVPRGGGDMCRRVNLDPGYVDRGKLVLGSSKFAAHRIYLGRGVFAEVTLLFENGHFQPLFSTYGDYREPRALQFFSDVRAYYLEMLRRSRRGGVAQRGTPPRD